MTEQASSTKYPTVPIPVLKPLGKAGCGVACIKTHNGNIQTEAISLAVKAVQIDYTVMYSGRSCERVGDDPELSVYRPMIEIEKPLGFAIAHHVAAVRIRAAHLGVLDLG